MYKKTITYKDYDGVERTEDFFFNLSKAELLEMEMETPGGMKRKLEKIVSEQDLGRLIEAFKDFILRSYGEKSPDGRRLLWILAFRQASHSKATPPLTRSFPFAQPNLPPSQRNT